MRTSRRPALVLVANPAANRADQERRRSNAAVPHPSRKIRRQTSRHAARAAAIRDQH